MTSLRTHFSLPDATLIRFFFNSNSSLARMAPTNSKAFRLTIYSYINFIMKKTFLVLFTLLSVGLTAEAKLNVVATLPDFGSLAREVGGDNVDVTVLAKPTEDPH